MVAVPVASYFFLGALNQDFWDWGDYLQGTHTGAFLGIPTVMTTDTVIDARGLNATTGLPL